MSAEKLRFNLHEHTGGNNQPVQGFDRASGRREDVDHALVRAHLELLPALLVHVRRPQYRVQISYRRKRNRPSHCGTGSLRRIDNLRRRLVQYPVIVRLQANSNAFS